METVRLTSKEVFALSTYSASNPTGTIVGKKWKREWKDKWYLCEYVEIDQPGLIGITTKLIQITEPTDKEVIEIVEEHNDKNKIITLRAALLIAKMGLEQGATLETLYGGQWADAW